MSFELEPDIHAGLGGGGDPNLDAQVVRIKFHGDGLIAGYAPGVVPPTWLAVSLPPTADPQGTDLRVIVNASDLAPGNYAHAHASSVRNSANSRVLDMPMAKFD